MYLINDRKIGENAARVRRVGAALSTIITVACAAPWMLPAGAAERPEEMTVTGRYPGPPLWKVSHGANELWIFATLAEVPKDITWGSLAVERVIGRADEVLGPPGINAWTRNPFRWLGLYRQAKKLSRNEDDAELADVLPPDLYERYVALRDQYGGRSLEDQRPAIAAARLYGRALDAAGLTSYRTLTRTIERLAKKADVPITETTLHMDPGLLLAEAKTLSTPAEIECFDTMLSSIERDLDGMAQRARAWALGDIEALRRFDYPDVVEDCLTFIGSAEGLQQAIDGAEDKWLGAAERALGANRTTFATLDMRELIRPDGLLARLRERGYAVREPSSVL
jgi:hypothetical protein